MTLNSEPGLAPPTAFVRSTPRAHARQREIKKFLLALAYLSPSLLIFVAFVFVPLVRSFILSLQLTDPIGRPVAFVGLT